MVVDAQRRKFLLAGMEANGFAALAGFTAADVLLLSGYWPVMSSSVALLSAGGDLVVVLPEDEVELAAATTTDAVLIPYTPESLKEIRARSAALSDVAHRASQRLSFRSGKIGVRERQGVQPMSYQTATQFDNEVQHFLKAAWPSAEIVAADDLFQQQKAVRSPLELDRLRHATSLAQVGFAAAPAAIRAGTREDEVAAEIEFAFSRVANHGFERGRGYFFCMSGPNSAKAAGAFARTRRRVLEQGDFVMIHANTVGDGSWTDITRTFTVGEPSPQQQRMTDAVQQARSAALNSIRVGAKASQVDAAARDVLSQLGFGENFPHAVGHGVGYAATDPNALPRLHPESPDRLVAGMTFNIEPAIYINGFGGLRHCDVVACTETGAEVLTHF